MSWISPPSTASSRIPLASAMVRREFYSQLIDVRREAILEPAYELYREERRHEKAIESPVSLKEEAKNAKEASKAMEQTAPPAERERDGNR